MPNMDGTGPRLEGRRMHGGMGYGHHQGQGSHCGHRRGHGFPAGHPLHDGCRCGLGPCAQVAQDNKAVLEAHKEALQRSLDNVEKRLEKL
ncbi:MAG TPA: DUF5320 domain-containing protein [Candidatus Limiplasma sp.]|nr:DUF5320 domain-containing protein [Candidatus Limiplasma sp.]HRX08888.1 DUF5320 domain-containing protein [Candidatus Limiplasma sp.]